MRDAGGAGSGGRAARRYDRLAASCGPPHARFSRPAALQEKESFRDWLSASAESSRTASVDPVGSHAEWRGSAERPPSMDSLRRGSASSRGTSFDLAADGMPLRPSADSILRPARTSDTTTAGRSSVGTSVSGYSASAAAAASARSSFALERASLEANRVSLEAFGEALAAAAAQDQASAGMQPPAAAGLTVEMLAANLGLPVELTDRHARRGRRGGRAGGEKEVAWREPRGGRGGGTRRRRAGRRDAAGRGGGAVGEHLFRTVARVETGRPVPPAATCRFARLSALPSNTPAPAAMLSKLWGLSMGEVALTLGVLAQRGAINVAHLPDGRMWCLPQPQQLQLLHTACRESARAYHQQLLDAYTGVAHQPAEGGAAAAPAAGAGAGCAPGAAAAPGPSSGAFRRPLRLQEVRDDGYFLINVGHHLVGAGRHLAMRALLLDPGYLMVNQDPHAKLVLEAFQMCVGAAVAHPDLPGLLRCLMAARLSAAAASHHPDLQQWLDGQRALMYEDARAAAAAGRPRCLPPLNACLDQAGGLQRLILRGHSGPVTKVLLTPAGTEAVTAGADGTARVWDLEIGDCMLVMEGHSARITDTAITSDGSLLLTGSADGTVRAFEMEHGQCLRVLAGHTAAVRSVAMDPWGRFVVTGAADGTARVWDLASARAIHVLSSGASAAQGGVCCVELSPCTRFVILGCANASARMFDVISGQCMGVMAGHAGWVVAVRFSPDGRRAVTASHDGTARVWDLRNGQCRHVLEGHASRINALAMGPAGKWAATASDDGTVRVWDLRKGACKQVLQASKSWLTGLAVSPCGTKLVATAGDGTASAFALEPAGEALCVLEGHSGPALGAAVTRKGRFAVTVSEDGSVRVWDFAARHLPRPRWHDGRVHCLALRSGVAVASAGEDRAARLWSAATGEFRGLLEGHKVPVRWAAFSADGRLLVTASPDRMVRLWDANTATCLSTLPAHHGSRMRSFATCADLSRAALCLWDGTVTVWEIGSGRPAAVLQRWGERDSATGHASAVNQASSVVPAPPRCRAGRAKGPSGRGRGAVHVRPQSVLMTSDGSRVVTLSKDRTGRVWDANSGLCLAVLAGHTDSVLGGCINDAARLLATHSFDNTVRLWSLDSGACVKTVHAGDAVQQLALSPDGWKVAAALAGSAGILVCDIDDAAPRPPWKAHAAEVTGLAFSFDSSELVSCSLDGTVRVWDSLTGALRGLFPADSGLTCCLLDQGSEHLACGSERGQMLFLDTGVVAREAAAAAPPLPATPEAEEAAEAAAPGREAAAAAHGPPGAGGECGGGAAGGAAGGPAPAAGGPGAHDEGLSTAAAAQG
eukprot:scaffold24.g2946.t1